MSYDIRVCVKVEGCDKYAVISIPEYDSPTYNLGQVFRQSMNWDFKQGEYYRADYALDAIEKGLKELTENRSAYIKYLPANGWGNIQNAIETFLSVKECIFEQAEDIPMKCLWMRW